MQAKPRRIGVFAAVLLAPWASWTETAVHHRLSVRLNAEAGQLQASDTVSAPAAAGPLRFSLNAGLFVSSPDPAVKIVADPAPQPAPSIKIYAVTLPQGRAEFTLNYRGGLELSAAAGAESDPQNVRAHIAADGAYLDGNGHWYPQFDDELVTFSMEVQTPPAWRTLSQGQRRGAADRDKTQWEEMRPQEEIYLLAGPYLQYDRASNGIAAEVLLRSPDPALADQYLSAIGEYLKMYEGLLGPYPYDKFAVVENIRESGLGMPSFTLLGSKVMRFPFIMRSSLPHEILHDWWGNGVYVDARLGNWSEGLTAYLADYLLQEQNGAGAAYRRNALLRYTNYVSAGNDFALRDFQARHNEASQAVGYDKALMVFHMLRAQLGDARFIAALRKFYLEQRFRRASWDDLRRAFESAAGTPLQSEFDQWLNRRGAPALQLAAPRAQRRGDHYELSAEIAQTQPGPAYRLHIPLAVQLEGQEQSWQTAVDLSQRRQTIHLAVPARPWRVSVDPEFDIFRRLEPGELPATLSEALGTEAMLIVLPSAAPTPLQDAYLRLAHAWTGDGQKVEIRWDKELAQFPAGRTVWLMGWENRFLAELAADLKPQAALSDHAADIENQTLRRADRAVVLAARRGGAPGTALLWLGCDNPAAFAGLARKLPHYGSYSYLAFRGDEPTNVLKGQWQVLDSPLTKAVAQTDHAVPPPAALHLRMRPALTDVAALPASPAQ